MCTPSLSTHLNLTGPLTCLPALPPPARFFKLLCVSMKVHTVVAEARRALEAGYAGEALWAWLARRIVVLFCRPSITQFQKYLCLCCINSGGSWEHQPNAARRQPIHALAHPAST